MRRAWEFEGSGMFRNNIVAATTFWPARGKRLIGCSGYPVSDVLPVYLSSPSADTSALEAWLVLLEDLFKQDKALTVFVKLCFELS